MAPFLYAYMYAIFRPSLAYTVCKEPTNVKRNNVVLIGQCQFNFRLHRWEDRVNGIAEEQRPSKGSPCCGPSWESSVYGP